nr:MAG TPA: hypothetical protein [Caudoviricetes sp.]
MAHVIVTFRHRPVDVLTHSPREGTIGITPNNFDLMITSGAVLLTQPLVFHSLKAVKGGSPPRLIALRCLV